MLFKCIIHSAVFLILLCFASCHTADPAEKPAVQKEIHTPEDTLDFAVIPFDTSNVWLTDYVFPKTLKAAELNERELTTIDSVLLSFFTNDNKVKTVHQLITQNTSSYSSPVFNLKEYKKQYIAVINDKSEKEVWINCFCKGIEKAIEFRDWKRIVVRVYDGGDCFFNLKLNLAHRKAYDLSVNSNG